MQAVSNKISVTSTAPFEVSINDKKIPIKVSNPSLSDEIVAKAIQSRKFQDWLQATNLTAHTFEAIEIRDVFMFGPIVGFICVNCRFLPTNALPGEVIRPLPGYVFLRGDAVVILVIIKEKETGKKHMVLTEQYRLPYGDTIIEYPAGMMDEEKHFKGQAAIELKEEAGIEIPPEDLHELLTFGPSLGGCDEKITAFYCELEKTAEEMKEIESKIYGLHEHGESIKVKIIDFDVNKLLSMNRVHSSATLCAMFAYQNLVENKK